MNVQTFVYITKKMNSVWFGKARVISVHLDTGFAIVEMLTGRMTGKTGGFALHGLTFRCKRIK